MATNDCVTRIATPSDAAAVESLLQASYPVIMASAYDKALLAPALELMTKANVSLLASGSFYVAQAPGGLVAGCGGWTRERPGTCTVEPKLGHIRHFATRPDWTHRGIGRSIYHLCETGARSAGVTTFECYSSLNAEAFYSALGFERVRTINIELGDGVALPSVLMRRRI